MNTALWWLAQNTLVTAAMIPLVLLLCRQFRTRPAVQHALWTVILLKFVTPVMVFWPWELPDIRESMAAYISAPSTRPDSSHHATELLPVEPANGGFEQLATPQQQPFANLSLAYVVRAFLISVWGTGTFVFALRQYRRVKRQAAIVRRGMAAPASLASCVREVANQLRLQPFPALIVRGIASPFVWCLGRLKLAWPEQLLRHYEAVAPRSIIAHELAHVRRRDHWIAWIEIAAAMIWWWNPLFWFVRRKARSAAEMACDALALAAYPDDRCEYAETLLWLSANSKTGAPVFVLGVNTGTPSSFERRMSMIVSQNVSGKLSMWGIVAAGCLALLALPGWLVAQQDSADADRRQLAVTQDPESTTARLDRLEAQMKRLIQLLEQSEKPAPRHSEMRAPNASADSAPDSAAKPTEARKRTASGSGRRRTAAGASAKDSDAARLDRLERAVERLSRAIGAGTSDDEYRIDPNAYKRAPEESEKARAPLERLTRSREQARHRLYPLVQPEDKPSPNASTTAIVGELGISVDPSDSTIIATRADGRLVWKTNLGVRTVSLIDVDGDTVLIYPLKGPVRKIDIKTGEVKE